MIWNELKISDVRLLIGFVEPGVIYTHRHAEFINIWIDDTTIRRISFRELAKSLSNMDDPNRTRRIARNIRSACKGKELTPDLVKNAAETMIALEGIT